MSKDSGPEWDEAILYAMDYAADSVEEMEYGGAVDEVEFKLHRRAAMEVAKRIRRMAVRYNTTQNKETDACR